MKELWKSLSDKTRAVLIAAGIAALNVLFVLIFRLNGVRIEDTNVTGLQFWLSFAVCAAHIGLCIFLRIRRLTRISLGIFIYQLIAVAAYLLFFAGHIGGQGKENGLTAFFVIFRWWTLGYQWLMVRVSWTTGIPFRYSAAIIYLILVYISLYAYSGAVRDIRYERQRAEDKAYVEAYKRKGIY